jgi:hypothetical protein
MHLSHPSFSQARLLQEVRWQRWDWRSTCDGTPNAWKGPWVSGFGKTIESIEVGFEVQSNCLCGKPVFFRPPAWVRVFTLQGNYHPAPPKAIKSPTSAWVVQALNIDWTHMTSNGGRTCPVATFMPPWATSLLEITSSKSMGDSCQPQHEKSETLVFLWTKLFGFLIAWKFEIDIVYKII